MSAERTVNQLEAKKGLSRHTPLRTCLGCGAVRPKNELLRLAGNRDGEIALDPQARLPGRGAYVCRKVECAELLRKKNSLSRGFRQAVPRDSKIYQEVIDSLNVHHR